MKRYSTFTVLAATLAALLLQGCFKEPKEQGFIGSNIYLQGADTLIVPIGQQVSTMTAWLDNSTRPVKFEIIDIRDKFGNTKEEFFKHSDIRVWTGPYDRLTDDTREKILAKIGTADVTPIMINEVNGQLFSMPTTADCDLDPGDVFNVDVRMTNSKGSVDIKDYAVIKFMGGSATDRLQLLDFVNGICVEYKDDDNSVKTIFPYYDQINDQQSDFSSRRSNIIADNGREKNMALRKIADEPSDGIKLYVRFLDQNGRIFAPDTYATYSTTTSYIDVGIDRVNDPEKGMSVEFPMTPWPVEDMYSYIRGTYYNNTSNLDIPALKAFYASNRTKASAAWDESIFAPERFVGWYVRVRSRFRFYEPGTYEMVMTVPFTTAN